MGLQRIRHDVSFACAHALLDIVGGCLREEERRDFWEAAYVAVKAALTSYEQQVQQERLRLNPLTPSRN